MPANPRDPGSPDQPHDGPTDPVIASLTERLRAATEDFEAKARRFAEALNTLKLEEYAAGFRTQFQELVQQDIQFTREFGEQVARTREHGIIFGDELTGVSKDFLQRVERWGQDLDGFKAWRGELERLIGIGAAPVGFNLLVTQYMDQVNFFAGIVQQFSVKVQTCSACMDIERYEALIKSYADIMASWGTLIKNVEDLLKSKAELVYNSQENAESLLKSYEALIKSGLEIEDMRLDLLNKPLRKQAEHSMAFEDLAKSVEDLIKSLLDILAWPFEMEEKLVKSDEDVVHSLAELLEALKPRVSHGVAADNALREPQSRAATAAAESGA